MVLQRDLKINFVELEIFGLLMVFKLVVLQKDCLLFESVLVKLAEVIINFRIVMLK